MRTSPIAVPEQTAVAPRPVPPSVVSAERVYLGSTIAAMLLLLSSLWLFR